MCYIMIAKKIGNFKGSEDQIRDVLKEKATQNDDGFFFQNGNTVNRTLEIQDAQKIIKDIKLDNLLVHFRAASVGVVSEANIHGWKIGNWTFFHNGGSSTYTDNYNFKKEQNDSDSYRLFQDLWLSLEEHPDITDKQVVRVIETLLKKINFWGRAALYNDKTDKIYLFGDFHVYNLGGFYLLFSSSFLRFDQKSEARSHGIKFDYDTPTFNGETTTDGVCVIYNFSTPDFQFKQLTEKLPERTYTPVHIEPAYKFNDNWVEENGIWVRKSKEDINFDKELNSEQGTMLENINSALEKLPENKGYTEKSLEKLCADDEFIGWDEDGNELYLDAYGYHFSDWSCCRNNPQTCRDFTKSDGIIFKEEIMEMKGA